MSLWDVLFGRDRLKRPRFDALFALPGACVNLEEGPGWRFAGRGGICLKRVEGPSFRDAVAELDGVIQLSAKEFGSRVEPLDDSYGYRWYILEDPDISDLVNALHSVASVASEHGFDGQLLAAVVRFAEEGAGRASDGGGAAGGGGAARYLIYNYKRGAFYAFAPTSGEARDHAAELRVQAALASEVPWERDLSRWYPLWDCPV